jgi:prepilin-type N-terminal cleavage/methylation domain-containing protein
LIDPCSRKSIVLTLVGAAGQWAVHGMAAVDNWADERGFTLVETLLVIVVVGILSAVAIVGIGGLTGTAKRATCQPTMDAARAAIISYFAKQQPSHYPSGFDKLVADDDLELHGGVANPTPTELTDGGSPELWKITLDPATGLLTASGASGHCR